MYCSECKIENDGNFCKNCGKDLTETSSNSNSSSSSSSWWANFVSIITKIVLVIEIIASIIGGFVLIGIYEGFTLIGVAVMLLGPIVAVLSNAFVMIFVNMAKDISAIRNLLNKTE